MRNGYPPLLDHILDGGDYGPMLRSPWIEVHRRAWRDLFAELPSRPPRDVEISNLFHTTWHVSHHFIRELVDDDELLLDAIRVWLPPYEGPSLTLYRGENIDRLALGKIGTAWSDRVETARMFASGWNSCGKGGVILKATVSSEAIIAGPSAHSSNWLGEREYTVDPNKLGGYEEVERFPPSL